MNIRMSTKGKRPLRSLTPSDKIHAIQRIHDGESKASVARDIGVPESTLRGWCKNEDKLRFMSRQSALDKIPGDLADRMDGSSPGFIGGPTEKRPKVDQRTVPINFSSKLKLDEMTYKRGSINGLDYSTSKALSDLGFNTLPADYATFNGSVKNKVFGADISRPNDPSISAVSPLSSLPHLSGIGGVSQSPLAISFSELTSNLNILAQLNPGLTAMSSLNELAASGSLRNVKFKAQTQIQSSRGEIGHERKPGITVKNWAKQQSANISNSETDYGLNLSQGSNKNKLKCQSPSLAPSLGDAPAPSTIPEDPILYWLKSQQAMLGLNNMYPSTTSTDKNSSPVRSSTPHHLNHPIDSVPLPSCALDEKNAAWITWCKAFGASLNSLAPIAVTAINTTSQVHVSTLAEAGSSSSKDDQRSNFENILYSHLTKTEGNALTGISTTFENTGTSNESSNKDFQGSRPEDLSAKAQMSTNTPSSPIEIVGNNSPSTPKTISTPYHSPLNVKKEDEINTLIGNKGGSLAECKDVLDNLLYKINCNQQSIEASNTESENDSDESYIEASHNNNDVCTNNNNSNKTDEEERSNCVENHGDNDLEAIKHGEKFLQWLEGCSNPRVTAVHLMQLRFLISALKSSKDVRIVKNGECITATSETSIDVDESQTEESGRFKTRRRK